MPFIDGLPSGTEQGALSLRHVRQLAPRAGAGGEAAGPDIGWAVACGALLLAAAILGLTGGKRREPAPRHARIAEVLKPLTGRR
jgi:hypothetical protein